MAILFQNIKNIIQNLNGVFALHEVKYDGEMKSFYNEVTNLDVMRLPEQDKKNMRADFFRLKQDLRKSISSYKEEMGNG